MLWGALAQSIPDIDFVLAFWLDPSSNLLAHRGFSHSIPGVVLFSIGASLVFRRWVWGKVGHARWFLFFLLQMIVHVFFDLFNTYGIGLFEPFYGGRFSFNTIFVADPLFSLPWMIAFIALLVSSIRNVYRKRWWKAGILLCSLYLSYAVYNKFKIRSESRRVLAASNISYNRLFTTPTPLNNFLWWVVAQDSTGFWVGYCSAVDGKDKMTLSHFQQSTHLEKKVRNRKELEDLKRFSDGFYTLQLSGDTLIFSDLRFGQIIGWHDPKERFVFHYYLDHNAPSNDLVVQRGRFAKWDKQTIKAMIRKISGK